MTASDSSKLDLTDWDLAIDPALLEVLGLMTVTFSHVEHELAFLIWSLLAEYDVLNPVRAKAEAQAALREQKAGGVLTSVLSFGRKLEVATTLVAERFGATSEQLSTFVALAKRCAAAEEDRNRVIHSSWARGESPGSSLRVKSRAGGKKGLVFVSEPVGRDSLVAAARTFNDLAFAVDAFRRQVYPRK